VFESQTRRRQFCQISAQRRLNYQVDDSGTYVAHRRLSVVYNYTQTAEIKAQLTREKSAAAIVQ